MVEVKQKKKKFRQQIKAQLAQLGSPCLAEKSARLSQRLNAIMQQHKRPLWGVFAPLWDEPNWPVQIENLQAFRMAWPQHQSRGCMAFFQCKDNELITHHQFGRAIPGPPLGRPAVRPDALLIPAVGLSPDGQRMGRGGGYYDRFLTKFNGLKIGLCFEEQLGHFPSEDHDQRVEMIVTDKQTIIHSRSTKSWTQ